MKKWLVVELSLLTLLIGSKLLGYTLLTEWLWFFVFATFLGIVVTLLLTKQTGYTSFLRYSVQFSPKDNLVNTRELLGKPKGIKIIEINKDTNEWLIISKLTKEEIQKSLDDYLDKNQATTKVTPKITLSPYIHAVFGGF